MDVKSCRFYGKSNLIFQRMRALHSTGGNQCALIFDAHSPCRMEIEGETPDEEVCPLAQDCFEFDQR